ncbi:MAG: phosphate acetyltransferase [Candidatus Firestonebacteria bacterium]
MSLLEHFIEKAKQSPKVIVFPEGNDERILSAAFRLSEEGIAKPIVLGNPDEVKSMALRLNLNIDKIKIENPVNSSNLEKYAISYSKSREGISKDIAMKLVKKSLAFGCMMVKESDAYGLVGGVSHATASLIQAAGLAIGYMEGITTASSFFIMVIPNCLGEKDKVLIFADCAVNINPNAKQLADIAVTSARSAKSLLGIEPNVAILSFSTKGSASHELVDKVIEATKLAKSKAPDLNIDGELQADAALVPKVALKKVKDSSVAGKANVLVFPDLNAGNIAYKLTQYLANASAYGPILQGFAKPVSDLSRGASVDDIIAVTAITSIK